MKRTILSSFLFLYPLGIAHHHHDTPIVYASSLGLAFSVINHSHVHHPDTTRRTLFGIVDACYMSSLPIYLVYRCFTYTPRFLTYLWGFMYFSMVVAWYMLFLGGRTYHIRKMENYSSAQKWGHVVFHIIGILGGSELYRNYGLIRR